MKHEDKLVYMANQIALFFRGYPEEEAAAGVHDHIVSFWTPKMRAEILERAERDPSGLDPLVATALHMMVMGGSPAHREAKGPDELGELNSDAG